MDGLTTLSSNAGRPGQANSDIVEASTIGAPSQEQGATYTRGGLTKAWVQRAKQLSTSDEAVNELRALARPRFAKRTADLRGLSPDDGACEATAQLIEADAVLEHVYVEGKILSNAAASSLARALTHSNSCVKVLSMRATSVSDEGARAIADALPSCKSIEVIDLSKSCVGSGGANALAEGAKQMDHGLTKLSLYGNDLDGECAECLADAAARGAIETIDVRQNIRMGPEAFEVLSVARGSAHRPSIWFF